jgi:hypothetical protein
MLLTITKILVVFFSITKIEIGCFADVSMYQGNIVDMESDERKSIRVIIAVIFCRVYMAI